MNEETEEMYPNPKVVMAAGIILLVIISFFGGYFLSLKINSPLSDEDIAKNLEKNIFNTPIPNISILHQTSLEDMTVRELRGYYSRYSFYATGVLQGIGHNICYNKPDYKFIKDRSFDISNEDKKLLTEWNISEISG
jgi:hypothetical protein